MFCDEKFQSRSLFQGIAVMTSESARMSTAREAAFRVRYPNSRGRITRVIALDAESAAIITPLLNGFSERLTVFSVAPLSQHPAGQQTGRGGAVLVNAGGAVVQLAEVVAGADMVVMVVMKGGNGEAASAIGNACSTQGLMTAVLILEPGTGSSDFEAARILKAVRPHASMIVLADDLDYVTDMLTALRA